MAKRTGRRRGLAGQMRAVEALRPGDPEQMHRFLSAVLGLHVPRRAIVEGSTAPFEYLLHTFFEDRGSEGGGDLVVWANRGGGKTYLGAVATLLDLLFKPGVQVRILGGSLEQSGKMYRYLRRLVELPLVKSVVSGVPTQRGVGLVNGSAAEVLSQSERSVRGQRVHKMRCDEVELFKPEVWEAAQLVTRSSDCGGVAVRGTVEALSTMHRPFGLMSRLVGRGSGGGGQRARVMRWCALDVVERCPAERDCGSCVLWNDCLGRAKEAEGFVAVDDLVRQWYRSSKESWASEMMCQRPRRGDSVYPGFDPAAGGRHVLAAADDEDDVCGEKNDVTPDGVGREDVEQGSGGVAGRKPEEVWIGGMDFGLRSPLVMLWARVMWVDTATGSDQRVEVVDEYVEQGLTLERHLEIIEQRPWPRPQWVGVDPAGNQRNSHTGLTDVQVLRGRGYKVKWVQAGVREGVERVRRRLDHGTLRVDPRCRRLVEALVTYHFDSSRPDSDDPVKDGPDHLCDALRYMIVNLERDNGKVRTRSYL